MHELENPQMGLVWEKSRTLACTTRIVPLTEEMKEAKRLDTCTSVRWSSIGVT